MDGGILLDSEQHGGGGYNTRRGKIVRGESVGGASLKKLTDITNLQQQCPKPSNQSSKLRSMSLATDNIIDQLQEENAALVKLLANRNAIIESNGAELLKLQSNFQKLKKQNLQLARANNQMLGELNSSRQRVRELQHELGCKNGVLKAREIEYMEKEDRAKVTCEIATNEVGSSQSEQSGQTFQGDNSMGNCRGNGKRRKASKSQSSVPAAAEQINSIEKLDKQRYCLRRQSTRLKAEKPGSTEDMFEVDDNKSSVSHKENLVTEDTPSGPTVPEATTEDIQSLGATNIDEVHVKEKVDSKRHSLRGQSSRLTAENSEPSEDSFVINDAKFPVLRPCEDHVEKSGTVTSSATFVKENKGIDNAIKFEDQEIRRSSVGRPLRQAAVKVQSYKEIPLNVKMRKPQ